MIFVPNPVFEMTSRYFTVAFTVKVTRISAWFPIIKGGNQRAGKKSIARHNIIINSNCRFFQLTICGIDRILKKEHGPGYWAGESLIWTGRFVNRKSTLCIMKE